MSSVGCVRLGVHASGVAEIVTHRPERHNAMMRFVEREQRLDDDYLIEQVYGSQAFRDGVAAFIGQ